MPNNILKNILNHWSLYARGRQTTADGPNIAGYLYLYVLWAKNGVHIFKWLKKIKIIIFCKRQKLYDIQMSVSINKVLLEHSHTFVYRLSVATFTLQLQSWVVMIEAIWPAKPKIFTIWPFKKKFADPYSAPFPRDHHKEIYIEREREKQRCLYIYYIHFFYIYIA